jgi:hypothetical protein
MNTHREPWGGSPGKVIPTTVSASACGLCSQLEPDAADHWSARSSGSRTREANGAYRVSLAPLRHLRILERGSQSQFEYRPADRRGRRLTRRQIDAATRQHPCRGERDSAMRSPLERHPGRAVLRRPVRLGSFRAEHAPDPQSPYRIVIARWSQALSEKVTSGCRI